MCADGALLGVCAGKLFGVLSCSYSVHSSIGLGLPLLQLAATSKAVQYVSDCCERKPSAHPGWTNSAVLGLQVLLSIFLYQA